MTVKSAVLIANLGIVVFVVMFFVGWAEALPPQPTGSARDIASPDCTARPAVTQAPDGPLVIDLAEPRVGHSSHTFWCLSINVLDGTGLLVIVAVTADPRLSTVSGPAAHPALAQGPKLIRSDEAKKVSGGRILAGNRIQEHPEPGA